MDNKIITAIIIDDDEEAISLLEIYLKAFREVRVIDRTINPKQGIKLLVKKMPDLVFLDIDMPDINGIEVAEAIKSNQLTTEIVFTTAHSKYAFKTLEVKPLDYLVKPFGPEELISVVNRYKTRAKRKALERNMETSSHNNQPSQKLKLPTDSGIILVNPEEIMSVKAQGGKNYITLTNGKTERVIMAINRLIDYINSPSFVKANRETYINLQFLRRIDRKKKICVLTHQDTVMEEAINRSTISFFEKMNCFPIS